MVQVSSFMLHVPYINQTDKFNQKLYDTTQYHTLCSTVLIVRRWPNTKHVAVPKYRRVVVCGGQWVRAHQQSRVQSSPVKSDSQRRGSDSLAYFQWPPRKSVHTSKVESSPLARVLPSQEC
jgi:hypothetical protein